MRDNDKEHAPASCIRCGTAARVQCLLRQLSERVSIKCPFCNLLFLRVKGLWAQEQLDRVLHDDRWQIPFDNLLCQILGFLVVFSLIGAREDELQYRETEKLRALLGTFDSGNNVASKMQFQVKFSPRFSLRLCEPVRRLRRPGSVEAAHISAC